jgi:dTDP-4-amino-4,6-dideoxygalactose transaminase
MRLGACPMIVSLHATKVFGIGEGGALLSRDTDLVDRVRRLAQFGFLGTREALLPGLNAKLSEYAAAVGLAGLDLWQETRARWNNVTNTYMHKLHHAPIQASPGFGKHFVSSTLSVLWPYAKPAIKAELAEAGIDTLRWWGHGCHAQPSFRHCPAEPLPVTDDLAARTIGLPFWQDLTPSQIDTACLAVSYVAERHAAAEHRASTLAAA